jgi:ABC-type sugar transport system substrate-binding protein
MNEDLLQGIRSGAVTGTVMENTEEKIRVILETAEKLLSGESVEKKNYVNLVAVTQESAKRYKG